MRNRTHDSEGEGSEMAVRVRQVRTDEGRVPPGARLPLLTHPNNVLVASIGRVLAETGRVSDDELGRVLASTPDYVLLQDDEYYLRRNPRRNEVLAVLAGRYERLRDFDGLVVYRAKLKVTST